MKTIHRYLLSLCCFCLLILSSCQQINDLPKGFSVSPKTQVMFAPGNLQYDFDTNTWTFAQEQFEMIAQDNIDDHYFANRIDLFGWSANQGRAIYGIGLDTQDEAYAGNFVDWGKNIDDGNQWYTLSWTEWQYLISKRKHAQKKAGIARIKTDDDGYVNGLILLPDTWHAPKGIHFQAGFQGRLDQGAYAAHQIFTISEWKKMEQAGAVFLPAAGSRSGLEIGYTQIDGNYWSASPYDEDNACRFYFTSNDLSISYGYRHYGFAVRLVYKIDK